MKRAERIDGFVREYRQIPSADPDRHSVMLTGDPELAAEQRTREKGVMMPMRIMDAVRSRTVPDLGDDFPEPTKVIEDYSVEL